MKKTRIVVTGYGAVTPVGNTVPEIWNSLQNGKSGIATLDSEELKNAPTTYGGLVKHLDAEAFLEKREIRRMDRYSVLSTVASFEALDSGNVKLENLDKYRVGCILGVGLGGMESFVDSVWRYKNLGWKAIPILTIPKIMPNSASSNIALKHGHICGPNYTINTACSSGTDAIAAAARHIYADEADVVLTGGVEATVSGFGLATFNVLHALSTRWNDEPERASRPFDRDRDGFVMSEGAAILVIESLEHAQKRGARILAELVGYANINDAHHQTAPDPEGTGIVQTMQLSLQMGNIRPEEIDYINAHGTSTPTNDPIETKAVKKVFQEHAYKLRMSSTKSMIGHCIGATGAVEAIACIKAIEEQFVPPTINLENSDPECDLNYVPNKGESVKVECAMSNTLGFGGHNGTLIFRNFKQ